MSIATYILVSACWTVLVWSVCVFLCRKWCELANWPAFWLTSIFVCVCTPILALIYLVFDPTPVLSLPIALPVFSSDLWFVSQSFAMPSLFTLIFAGYVLGAVVSLLRIGLAWVKLSKQAKRTPFTYIETSKARIKIIKTSLDIPPCSFGVRTPVILMPNHMLADLSAQETNLIYAHEAAHIEARDPLVMLILLMVRAIYWPHPIMHNLFKRWQLATELRADNSALLGANPNLRKTYGHILVDVMRSSSEGALPCPSASLNLSSYRSAKMRVNNIMNPNLNIGKINRHKKVLGLSGAVLLLSGIFGISAVAGERASPDKNAQPITRTAPTMPANCSHNAGKYAAKVQLKFDVSKEGHVEHVRVSNSDNACFNEESIRTVKKWHYAPNTRKLKNVETMMAYIVTN